ncbi:hypothetical protein A1Q1_03384 [Trichosporon asahii var. asahii CBS 2479]|uniref:GATA-type domain-containing protein n=1 Tax=Trichosporon asahii var. asahii (strain ATCC 90039 / CBS 2479 / JCM 2466 / KCTC 7840 / NBRC 103889/ NCYC 2677 / UAMH 7654) TaxID=1186058 RepID=J6FBU0_TRIAS|nr:hypothetical protein A1Q1_03384 [Trichosporon asahii var. asahii CBS 2479]EJT52582.1 hypothetical protein A1Q1_03384 [Trichosporon asahii var. asahii CBS 2479]
MAKKASRSSSKGPALRQRRSGASSSSVGESTKRAAASGKKINPITGQRQPKQPPRKLAVETDAQMDTCLWRTHPSPDADGGKVKLCNACGIHIRDKGYNRKVTPEMLQRQSSQAQATRRAWAIQNGHESDSDIPSSPTSSEFSDDGAPPSPAASDSTKAATPPPSPLPAVPAMPTSSSAGPAVRKNSLKASPKASPKSLKSKAARKASKAARPAPLKLTKSAFDTSSNLPSPTSDASDAPLRKKEVSIRPKPVSTMSDEEAADALFRLISDAWRQYDGCIVHSSASDGASCCSGSSEADSNTQASSSSCIDTDSQPSFHTQLPPPIFPGDVFYPTPGPEKSFHGFGAYQNYEAPAYVRRDSLESATSAASANIMTPPVTPVLYANNGCTEKGYPPEGYGADLATDHFFAH